MERKITVPVSKEVREEFIKKGRELGRCLVCKEPWGDRSSEELLKRHQKCFDEWMEKWSKRPA
jgi:hypothetical protein